MKHTRILENAINKRALFKLFTLIYLPIILILTIVLMVGAKLDTKNGIGEIKWRENNRIEVAKGLVIGDLSGVSSDLRLATNIPALKDYLDSGKSDMLKDAEVFLLSMAQDPLRYDQISYLDEHGQEIIRIDYNGGNPAIVPAGKLQNREGQRYFNDTFTLDKDEIYISPLNLSIAQDALQTPDRPKIYFGTPLFDSTGKKKGIILLHYFADELLQHFRSGMQGQNSHASMLLNRDSYWLSSSKREDEWGFVPGHKNHSFKQDFTEAWSSISREERGALQTGQGLFVYTTVYPLLEQRSPNYYNTGRALTQHEMTARDYYWKIVSFVNQAELSKASFYNQTGGRIIIGVAYALLAICAFLIALAALKRKQIKEELLIAATAFETDESIMITDRHAHIIRVNSAFTRLTGYSIAEVKDKTPTFLHSERHDTAFFRSIMKTLQNDKCWKGEIWNTHKDGTTFPTLQTISDVTNDRGEVTHYVYMFSDITQRKLNEEKINFLAYHDRLTGLPNRTLFYDRLSRAVSQTKRKGICFALLFLDLDGFKTINDQCGHEAGDQVLKTTANRLVASVREIDTAARIGGDEFVIILDGIKRAADVSIVAKKIIQRVMEPILLHDKKECSVGVSIGIALYPQDGVEPEDLLIAADTAMYASKAAGKGTYMFAVEQPEKEAVLSAT